MNIGCAILELCIRDKNGELTDVMCGMENYETKIRMKGLAGATVGRVANRIADAKFVFNGKRSNSSITTGAADISTAEEAGSRTDTGTER